MVKAAGMGTASESGGDKRLPRVTDNTDKTGSPYAHRGVIPVRVCKSPATQKLTPSMATNMPNQARRGKRSPNQSPAMTAASRGCSAAIKAVKPAFTPSCSDSIIPSRKPPMVKRPTSISRHKRGQGSGTRTHISVARPSTSAAMIKRHAKSESDGRLARVASSPPTKPELQNNTKPAPTRKV